MCGTVRAPAEKCTAMDFRPGSWQGRTCTRTPVWSLNSVWSCSGTSLRGLLWVEPKSSMRAVLSGGGDDVGELVLAGLCGVGGLEAGFACGVGDQPVHHLGGVVGQGAAVELSEREPGRGADL